MTNYFLMSLAVADLLVCMIVMPFGAIVFFKGCLPSLFCALVSSLGITTGLVPARPPDRQEIVKPPLPTKFSPKSAVTTQKWSIWTKNNQPFFSGSWPFSESWCVFYQVGSVLPT